MNDRYPASICWRLAGVIMLVVALALAANAYLSHRDLRACADPVMGATRPPWAPRSARSS